MGVSLYTWSRLEKLCSILHILKVDVLFTGAEVGIIINRGGKTIKVVSEEPFSTQYGK